MFIVALKSAAAVVALIALIVAAGVTGTLFRLWPTSWPDQEMRFGDAERRALGALKAEPKFVADETLYYPGARNDVVRRQAEALVNGLIDDLLVELPNKPRKSTVLRAFKRTLIAAKGLDTEDQERLGLYLNQVMDALGVASSNELLNVWRLGFPYGWFIAST